MPRLLLRQQPLCRFLLLQCSGVTGHAARIQRTWLKVIRSQTTCLESFPPLSPSRDPCATEKTVTRAERAHWRLSWQQRLARNARPADAPRLLVKLCQSHDDSGILTILLAALRVVPANAPLLLHTKQLLKPACSTAELPKFRYHNSQAYTIILPRNSRLCLKAR
jgi:hypothetical protein